MDLQKLIVDSLNKMESEGKIVAIIDKYLTEAVSSAVSEVFRYSSPLVEGLKKAFKEKAQVDLSELSIPEYNKLMLARIQGILDGNVYEVGLEKFENDMKKVLAESMPVEMKVSDIIRRYVEELDEDERKGELSFFSEKDREVGGYFHFYFDNEVQTSQYSCKYQVHCCSDGTIYSFRSEKLKHDQVRIGSIYGIDRLFFKLYSAGTKIIPDFDCVETEYSHEEY